MGDEKKQLSQRLPVAFILRVIDDFNRGLLDAATAASELGIGRTRLYELRSGYLRHRRDYQPGRSGGNRRSAWPEATSSFLESFLPLQHPPNYQLVADELERLHGFRRARSTVEAYVKAHFGHLVPREPTQPRAHRRFRRASIGELWQHDSSIHQWWPAEHKQTLLLTVDDHSGVNLAGRFVARDTTWNHFCHFRAAFLQWGLPECVYTDALSLFGPSSTQDHSDPLSEFQRAFLALGVAHRVAPSPQAKGKIERRFGTFQRRMVTLLAYAKVSNPRQADEVLQMEIKRQNRTVNRQVGMTPMEAWERQCDTPVSRMRPGPNPRLLDLHLSLRCSRRVNSDSTIEFLGQSYPIGPTTRQHVTIVHHPGERFWVVDTPPATIWPSILAEYGL